MSVILQSYELKLQFFFVRWDASSLSSPSWLTSTTLILAISRERVLKRENLYTFSLPLLLCLFLCYFCVLSFSAQLSVEERAKPRETFFIKIHYHNNFSRLSSLGVCLPLDTRCHGWCGNGCVVFPQCEQTHKHRWLRNIIIHHDFGFLNFSNSLQPSTLRCFPFDAVKNLKIPFTFHSWTGARASVLAFWKWKRAPVARMRVWNVCGLNILSDGSPSNGRIWENSMKNQLTVIRSSSRCFHMSLRLIRWCHCSVNFVSSRRMLRVSSRFCSSADKKRESASRAVAEGRKRDN